MLDWWLWILIGVVLICAGIGTKRWTPQEVQSILWFIGVVLVIIGIIVLAIGLA